MFETMSSTVKQDTTLRFTSKLERDRKARELRKQGYTVECKTWDFTDLARAISYELTATRTIRRV
jgi:hypothetical protein